MREWLRSRILGLAIVLAMAASPSLAEDVTLINDTFKAHRVDTSLPSLATFLEKGWGVDEPKDLPKVPPEKTALLINAWELIALRYQEVRQNPALKAQVAELARRYAIGDFPLGARRIIERDSDGEAIQAGQPGKLGRTELLRYNGMIALGLFGEPRPDVIEAARKVYDAEDRPMIRVTYATTLALLGDRPAVGDLIAEVEKANSTSSVAAARALSILFGRSFGITPFTAAGPRREAVKQIQKWWDSEGKNTPIDRNRAIERQIIRGAARPYPLGTLDELLRAAADTNDLQDVRGSRTAWNKLRDMAAADGPGLSEQLRPIIEDRNKDLDIRDQALRWYVRINEATAKPLLKKIRRDPNPEIADLANRFLRTLKQKQGR